MQARASLLHYTLLCKFVALYIASIYLVKTNTYVPNAHF